MDKVFFNRVPKVGSLQLINLIKDLREIYNFEQINPDGKVAIKLEEDDENDLAEKIAKKPEPAVYIQHTPYINFAKYDLPRPIYINLIRDPVERIISWYYYRRSPWIFLKENRRNGRPIPNVKYIKKEFEKCVLTGDWECQYIEDSYIADIKNQISQSVFFCGHNENDCMKFNSLTTLQIAKRRVEQEFAVVGTWEETNITLKVLEAYIPKYFTGATELYYLNNRAVDIKNQNPFKPKISEKIKDIIKQNITREVEFYEFCKQRLYKQYLALFPDMYGKNVFNYDY